jgi:hypothetical protein
MTFAKKSTLLFLFLATSFIAGSAQEVARFTLQQPTSFSGTLLPAGSYQLQTINRGTMLALITSTDRQTNSVLLVPKSHDYSSCAKSSLHLESKDGQWSATSICLAEAEITWYFADRPTRATVTAAALAPSH